MEQKFITVPFDLSKAKQITNGELEGKIVTRDGRNARIICWDRNNETYPIVVLVPDEEDRIEDSLLFTENGTYYEEGETNDDLFLQIPEYLTFKDGDIITDDEYGRITMIQSDIREDDFFHAHYYADLFNGELKFYKENHTRILDNARLATESEKQRLIGALQVSTDQRAKDCLKKLGVEVKNKYNLKPFDKVLVRDSEEYFWIADFYSHIENEKFACVGGICKYCIPYEGNEHLLGTTKSAEE